MISLNGYQKNRKVKEKGSVLLLTVLFLMGSIIAGVIAFDVGMLVVHKAKIAQATDSAAIAGAYSYLEYQDMPDVLENKVRYTAKKVFYENFKLQFDQMSKEELESLQNTFKIHVDMDTTEKALSVETSRTIQNRFARWFQIAETEVYGLAKTKVHIESIAQYKYVKPIGIPFRIIKNNQEEWVNYQPGDELTLQEQLDLSQVTGNIFVGDWSFLSETNENAGVQALVSNIVEGLNKGVEVWVDTLSTVPGERVESILVKRAMVSLIEEQEVVILPVVDFFDSKYQQGRYEVPVKGFVAVEFGHAGESVQKVKEAFLKDEGLRLTVTKYIATQDFKTGTGIPNYGFEGVRLVR